MKIVMHLVVSDIEFGKCTDPKIYVYANILPMDMPNPYKAQRVSCIILGLAPIIFLILMKYYNINEIFFVLATTIAVQAIDVYKKVSLNKKG